MLANCKWYASVEWVLEMSQLIGIVMSRRHLTIRYYFAWIVIGAPHLGTCRGYGTKPENGYKWHIIAISGQNRHLRDSISPRMQNNAVRVSDIVRSKRGEETDKILNSREETVSVSETSVLPTQRAT